MTAASANEPGIFEIMHTTRSMRRLKPDPVPNALIRQILEAGVSAANGGNMQRWRFLVVQDPKVKENVAGILQARLEGERITRVPRQRSPAWDFGRTLPAHARGRGLSRRASS